MSAIGLAPADLAMIAYGPVQCGRMVGMVPMLVRW